MLFRSKEAMEPERIPSLLVLRPRLLRTLRVSSRATRVVREVRRSEAVDETRVYNWKLRRMREGSAVSIDLDFKCKVVEF